MVLQVLAAVVCLVGNAVLEASPVRFLAQNQELASRKIGVRDPNGVTILKDLSSKKRSAPYSFEMRDGPLVLVDMDGDDAKPLEMELPIAADLKSPLVLMIADEEGPFGLRALVVEDGFEGFPWGTMRFVNTTANPLVIRTTSGTVEIGASCALRDIHPGEEAGNIGLQLYAPDHPDDVRYSAVWEHDPAIRKLAFIVDSASPEEESLQVLVIPETRQRLK